MAQSASSSFSGDSNVRGLIRKYSSDSDASPVSKPLEKKCKQTMMESSDSSLDGGGSDGPSQAALPPPKDLADAMLQMRSMMTSFRNDIIDRIVVSENKVLAVCKEIEDKLMLEIAAVNSKITALDTKVTGLGNKVNGLEEKLTDYSDRLKIVEDAMAANGTLVQDFDPEYTVIVTNVTYSDTEDLTTKCQEIIDHIRTSSTPPLEPIPVVKAIRTPFRDRKPGVIKLQLPTVQNKKDILKGKRSLSNSTQYSRAFIRGSQSHTERLLHLNTNTLLNELGLADRYRVSGNGRLVPKQFPVQQFNGQPGQVQQTPNYGNHGPPPPNQWHGFQQQQNQGPPWRQPGPRGPPAPPGPPGLQQRFPFNP